MADGPDLGRNLSQMPSMTDLLTFQAPLIGEIGASAESPEMAQPAINTESHPEYQDIYLQIGDFYFGEGSVRIRTVLGSCISITMWHPQRRIGGMCHYLLPDRLQANLAFDAKYGCYATEVIEMFLASVYRYQTKPRDYVIKLFGGGNMFPQQMRRPCGSEVSKVTLPKSAGTADNCDSCNSVACRNVLIARQLLQQYGFSIHKEHVGGTGSRQLIFDIASGDAWIRHTHPTT